MSAHWTLTDQEFVALWRESNDDALPIPLVYTSRTRYEQDHRRGLRSARERIRSAHGPAMDVIFESINHPDLRIAAYGCVNLPADDPKNWLRLLAVRRRDEGFVVKQLPGETLWHSRGFTITPCEAVRLADVIAAELPECPRGSRGNLELATLTTDNAAEPDMDYSYGRSRIDFNQLDDSPTYRAREFLTAPAHSTGVIEIEQGASDFGPQGITRRRLEWRDLEDDGRYIIDGQHPPIATAADATRVRDLINVEIAVVIHAIRDERGPRG
jgi:hypothetical protein